MLKKKKKKRAFIQVCMYVSWLFTIQSIHDEQNQGLFYICACWISCFTGKCVPHYGSKIDCEHIHIDYDVGDGVGQALCHSCKHLKTS